MYSTACDTSDIEQPMLLINEDSVGVVDSESSLETAVSSVNFMQQLSNVPSHDTTLTDEINNVPEILIAHSKAIVKVLTSLPSKTKQGSILLPKSYTKPATWNSFDSNQKRKIITAWSSLSGIINSILC
jgi:hypothetical protein